MAVVVDPDRPVFDGSGGRGLSLAAALWVRSRARTMRELALVWLLTGATVALEVSVLLGDP